MAKRCTNMDGLGRFFEWDMALDDIVSGAESASLFADLVREGAVNEFSDKNVFYLDEENYAEDTNSFDDSGL